MIDLQTISIASAISNSVVIGCLIILWQLNKSINGLKYWLASITLCATGFALGAFRGTLADSITIVLSNVLILNAIIFNLQGVKAFTQQRFNSTPYYVYLYALFTPLALYYTVVQDNFLLRYFLVNGSGIAIFIITSASIKRYIQNHPSVSLSIFANMCALFACLAFARLLSIYINVDIQLLFSFNTANTIGALLSFLIPLGVTFGVFLLVAEKRELEIEKLKQQAERNAELKDRYLATLSHELRTPLNGIVGHAQLMLDDPKNITEQTFRTIINSGQHLAKLATDILQYLSLQKDQSQGLKLAQTELAVELSEAIDLLRPAAEQKQLNYQSQLSDSVPKHCYTDITKLKGILFNLISNAIEYTDHGTIEVSIDYSAVTKQLRLTVTDTGTGLSAAEFSRMLKPFVTGKNSAKKMSTGLGLAIVKQLVDSLNGQLTYVEASSPGSILQVTIPIEEIASNVEQMIAPPSKSSTQKVLLVEDVPLNREVLSKLLVQQNHQVDVAINGADAINQLTTRNYDLVMLDMQLPDMSGVEVYKSIVKQSLKARVIAVTAAVSDQDMVLYQQLGIDSIIAKPIDKSTLLATIQSPNLAADEKQKPRHTFSTQPLMLLKETMSRAQLSQKIVQLKSEFETDLTSIKALLNSSSIIGFQKKCHKMSGFYGQFGLTGLAEKLKEISSIEHKRLVNLDIIEVEFYISFKYLEQYWQSSNE